MEIYYYHHPESSCVWKSYEEQEYSDGLVEQIDRETYLKLKAKYND